MSPPMSSIPAAKERLAKLRDELTRRSSYVNHIPSARERDAGNAAAIDAILADHTRLEEENSVLQQAVLDRLEERKALAEENAELRAERDAALEQVAAYRAGCVRVFNNLCQKCRGHAELPEKAKDPTWPASITKGGADV